MQSSASLIVPPRESACAGLSTSVRKLYPSATNELEKGPLIPNKTLNNWENCVLWLIVEGSLRIIYSLRNVGKTYHGIRISRIWKMWTHPAEAKDDLESELWLAPHKTYFHGSFRAVQRVFSILFGFTFVKLGSHSLVSGFDFHVFFIFICIISISLNDKV